MCALRAMPTWFLLLHLPQAAAAARAPDSACPTGWTIAPHASCLGVVTERASSLRDCVEACAQHGAVPACVGSHEENDLIAALVEVDDVIHDATQGVAWLGRFQSDTGGGADEGWARCVAGEAPGLYTNWAAGEPNDAYGPESCAIITSQGEWRDWPCDVPRALGVTAPLCVCSGPANASSSFAEDLDELEAAWAAHMREARATVAVLYPLLAVVALLPSLLLLCFRGTTHLRRRRAAVAAAGEGNKQTGTAEEQASHAATAQDARRAARPSAERLQVSFAMVQTGWALGVLGLVPPSMYLAGRPIDAVVGPNVYWALLAAPGSYLLVLALLAADARAARVVCASCVAASLVLAALFAFLAPGALPALVAPGALQAGGPVLVLGFNLPTAVLILAAAAALVGCLAPCLGRSHGSSGGAATRPVVGKPVVHGLRV